jgi:hypothetical protein
MWIIKEVSTQSYIREVFLSGEVDWCYMPYQAKIFRNAEKLKTYTDFLDDKGWRYEVERFEYSIIKSS